MIQNWIAISIVIFAMIMMMRINGLYDTVCNECGGHGGHRKDCKMYKE